MNNRWKLVLALIVMAVWTAACSSPSSWEEEAVQEVSDRLLADDVEASWAIEDVLTAGAEEGAKRIRLELRQRDGGPVEAFDVNHEKLLHLMVVSGDLSYFNHIHPEYLGGGVFEIDNTFPAGGDYRLIADFKPSGGDAMTKLVWMQIGGERAAPVPAVPDVSPVKTVDGTRVELAASGLAAGADTTLAFTLTDAASGQPLTDLQAYLGATGHVVILSEDGERYVHAHAEESEGSGSEAVFETAFPGSGVYKIWAQFQRNGRVFTVPYVVRVT